MVWPTSNDSDLAHTVELDLAHYYWIWSMVQSLYGVWCNHCMEHDAIMPVRSLAEKIEMNWPLLDLSALPQVKIVVHPGVDSGVTTPTYMDWKVQISGILGRTINRMHTGKGNAASGFWLKWNYGHSWTKGADGRIYFCWYCLIVLQYFRLH